MQINVHTASRDSQVVQFVKNGEYFFDKGIVAYRKNDLRKAIRLLERAVKLEPRDPVFICQLAAMLAEVGEYKRSNELLQHIITDIDDQMNECHFFLANNYAHLGLFSEAQKEASYYIENELDGEFFEDAQDLLDLLHFENDDLDLAIETEDQLIIKYEQAKAHLQKGLIDDAISVLEDVTIEYPTLWAAHNLLAEALFLKGRKNEAIKLLEKVLEKDEMNLITYSNLAVFYSQLGDGERAAPIIQALKVVHPVSNDHRYKVATTLGLVEEHERAYELFYSLPKRGFEGGAVYYHRFAASAFHTGRFSKAKSLWEQSKKYDHTVADYYIEQLKKGLLKTEDVVYNYIIPTGV